MRKVVKRYFAHILLVWKDTVDMKGFSESFESPPCESPYEAKKFIAKYAQHDKFEYGEIIEKYITTDKEKELLKKAEDSMEF